MSFLVSGFGKTFFQGSTGIKFSDVAGIDDAVDELQEVWIHGWREIREMLVSPHLKTFLNKFIYEFIGDALSV